MPDLPQRIAAFYRALDIEGRIALEELDSLYAVNVRFIDPMQETHGRAELRHAFDRMFDKYDHVYFPTVNIVGGNDQFMGTWTMVLRQSFGPEFTVRGASSFVAEDGLVVFQQDFWDLLGSAMNSLPALQPIYKRVVKVLFG